MTKHIEEDWERMSELDKMYLLEKQKEIEEEWQQWEEEQEKLPAKIKVKKKNETEISNKDKLENVARSKDGSY